MENQAVGSGLLPEGDRRGGRVSGASGPGATPASETAEPSISVIVPTHNRPAYVLDAVRSVACQKLHAHGPFEILVIENAPRPSLEAPLEQLADDLAVSLRHVHEPRPGLHQARHRGAYEASGSILVFIDDDVIVDDGWLDALVDPFRDPEIAIVGGPVRPLWESPPPEWIGQFPASYLSLLDAGDEPHDLIYPDGAYGCNLAIRRAVLFDVGGFNPDAMGWNRRLFWLRGDGETGLHKKVTEAGYRVRYEPSAGLVHRIPATRMTPKAMRRRALLVGLSHSFADLRGDGGLPRRQWRRAARAAGNLGMLVRHAASVLRHPSQWRFRISEAWRRYGYVRQHLLVFFDRSARAFIEKESYLGNGDASDSQ
jgi:glycosyltransferase involved in cell wall biosynthesis